MLFSLVVYERAPFVVLQIYVVGAIKCLDVSIEGKGEQRVVGSSSNSARIVVVAAIVL